MTLHDQLQRTLGDAYTIERELGGGGMSRVFVATERSLGREVVVKILPQEMAGQLSGDRFKREIAVAARLQHPHIVPLLTAGNAEGLPFFTMPFVKGESLRVRLERQGEFPVGEAIRTLREIAGALAFAHASGVVHRDIKPENILLSGGVAMVTDFGVAKALSESAAPDGAGVTTAGVALGTPTYMAPEQASADPTTDHRADIYAWGVLAYELLTGAPPFSGRPVVAILAAHVTEAPEPIARRRPSIPAPLAALVMRCLEKRPADRPQGAGELIEALDALHTPGGGVQPVAGGASGARLPAMLMRGGLIVVGCALLAIGWLGLRRGDTSVEGVRAIAVLPFENASGDPAFNYLAEGVSDEVRSQLTRLGVPVRARASSQAFGGRLLDLQEVARTLNVTEVISGSARQVGDRIRVTAELIQVEDGTAIWSLSFEARDTNLVAIQDSIVRAAAGALRALGLTSTATAAGSRGTTDFVAYESFLKGEYHRRRYELVEAIPFLRAAVARDPTFARAHAALAAAYATLPAMGIGSADSARVLAGVSIDRAMALDSTLIQTLIAKTATLLLELRFPDALETIQRAVALAPEEPEAHVMLAWALGISGEVEASLAAGHRARALDPLSTDALLGIYYAHYMAHRYDASITVARELIALDAKAINAYLILAMNYAFLGHGDSAVTELRRAEAIDPTAFGFRGIAIFVYAAAGQWEEARAQQRLARDERGNSPHFQAMMGHIAFGEVDAAVAAAERGIRDREPLFSWLFISCDPIFDPLKQRPQHLTLLKELGAQACAPEPRWPVGPPR